MEINDLNIPPTEEPFGKKLSRVASQLIVPVLLPVSSVFFGWLAQRRISIQLSHLHKEKEQIADLKENVATLQKEIDILTKQREISRENLGVTAVRRRRLLEEAVLKEEEEATQKILRELEELRPLLKQRQDIYCNPFQHRRHRIEVESKLMRRTYSNPNDKELGLYIGIQDILQNDKSCGVERNGCLMWVYLHFWKTQAELLKYKRVAERMKSIDESFIE